MQAQIAAELALAEQNRPTPEEIEARNHELAKNARCKMFYVYRPITVSELKVGGALYERQLYKFRICSVHHYFSLKACFLYKLVVSQSHRIELLSQYLKVTQKVSFYNIASEAS